MQTGLEEDDSMDECTGTIAKPRRRQNHNEIERRRRLQQRHRLLELRDVIPALQTEKISTVLVLVKAKEYIETLKSHIRMLETQGRSAQGSPLPELSEPSVTERSDKKDAMAMLKKENEELKSKIAEMKQSKQLIYLKRESSADRDFEALRGTFGFSRRNSSFSFPVDYRMQPIERNPSISKTFDLSRENSISSLIPFLSPLAEEIPLPADAPTSSSEIADVNCRRCGSFFDGSMMLDCDACHSWFHSKCIGMMENAIPSKWICDICCTKKT